MRKACPGRPNDRTPGDSGIVCVCVAPWDTTAAGTDEA